ncbi:MAG: hypothetical protein AAGD11_17685 [Planctomycetota bacterium]
MSPVTQRVLIDTGPIVAILDKHDQHHRACVQAGATLPEVVYTCWPVVTEACYLLRSRPDLVEELLAAVNEGIYELLTITSAE